MSSSPASDIAVTGAAQSDAADATSSRPPATTMLQPSSEVGGRVVIQRVSREPGQQVIVGDQAVHPLIVLNVASAGFVPQVVE